MFSIFEKKMLNIMGFLFYRRRMWPVLRCLAIDWECLGQWVLLTMGQGPSMDQSLAELKHQHGKLHAHISVLGQLATLTYADFLKSVEDLNNMYVTIWWVCVLFLFVCLFVFFWGVNLGVKTCRQSEGVMHTCSCCHCICICLLRLFLAILAAAVHLWGF